MGIRPHRRLPAPAATHLEILAKRSSPQRWPRRSRPRSKRGYAAEALARTTYHVDGQLRDGEEPYNYTPFKQGKMFAAGVTCSDCHEPHSAKLRGPGEGVCLQCHAPDKYADAKHRLHADVDPKLTYISCHMPARTYMVVDTRHDHAFRVPRPDLTVKLGTPNPCNDCHSDKSAQWAADTVEQRFGPDRKSFQTFAPAFHAARNDQADAAALLGVIAADRTAPAVARASALAELASRASPANIATARSVLADPDPVPIGDVAAALCYSAHGPFIDGFRRWSGAAPSVWRHAVRDA